MADTNPGNNQPASKFTRCRTGCLRCRKRRRKCDEKKPRCQNCVDKSFVCNYGLQVTFLPKNSITVTRGELHSLKSDSTHYSSIQFVNEEPSSIDNVTYVSSIEESPSPFSSISSTGLSNPSLGNENPEKNTGNLSAILEHTTELDQSENYDGNDFHPDASSAMASWSMGSNDSCQNKSPTPFKSPINRGTFSDKDEFAVRSLLALGTGAEAGPEPVYDAVSGINTIPYLQNMDHKVDTPLASSAPNKTTEVSCPGAHSGFLDEIVGDSTPVLRSSSTLETGLVTETQRLKLLQHYRYHVAPWLDICDLKHAFGIAALQMAVHSERLLSVLLALSKICIYKRSRDFQMIHSDDFGGSHTPELPSDRQSLALHADFTETLLVRVFQELHYLVSDVSHAWRNINGSDYGPLQSLVDTAYGLDIDSAVYWMFFRLDLGKALANNTPIRIQLPSVTIPSLSLLCRTDDAPERVAHYTQALLWMCGKALIIGHRESIPPQRHQLTDTWLNVFEELNQWRHSRPQEFYPMVELNGEDPNLNPGSQFPLLLFTNGAAALCNQLYHTAMLLLLECKPRTTLLNNPHSPVLSSLWHAQRVCGIALNNDRRECWDPCLLASFLVAARYMTHESQQQEIVEGFDRIQEITGWGIGEYLTQLREEWSFLEGGSNELQEIR